MSLDNGIFHPIQIRHTLSISQREKIFCVYGYFSVSRYIKGGKKSHHDTRLNF